MTNPTIIQSGDFATAGDDPPKVYAHYTDIEFII